MESIVNQPSCSSSPHAPITVTNVNNKQSLDSVAKLKASAEDLCSTPKKMPAKTLFKKEAASANTNAAGTTLSDDASFQEFLAKVKLVAQQDTRCIPTFAQLHVGMPSPQRNNFAMLPEYAIYQEARIQRALSRGNSFSSLNNVSPISSSSPGAEWVADYSRGSPRSVERAWNEETLISRHAFPSSIFCTPASGAIADDMPSPDSSLDLSDVSASCHDFSRRQAFQKGGSGTSIPDAADLSRGSSSSWSDEEQMGVRKFIQLLELSPSFSTQPALPSCHESTTAEAWGDSKVTLVEIAPGVSEPLRKADETVTAVRNDFYVPVSCFGCSQDILCIADAKYVICPTCRVVSPIEEGALEGQSLKQRGLGLGFNFESLFQIQSEILSER